MWGIPRERRTLAVLEGRVNDPFPFSPIASRLYGLIIFASHYHTEEAGHFGWPWEPPQIELESSRRNRIVMINANKFSAAQGEQYSLRRIFLREAFSRKLPIDLYGSDWTRHWAQNLISCAKSDVVHLRDHIRLRQGLGYSHSRYRALNTRAFPSLGKVENKYSILNNYRFSLVIENDITFLTEKAMDPLASGCITFYLGPEPSWLRDLPGVVLLPHDSTSAINLMTNYLHQDGDTQKSPQIISNTARLTLSKTSGRAWERLAIHWLAHSNIS
jgi:hypothetical protein